MFDSCVQVRPISISSSSSSWWQASSLIFLLLLSVIPDPVSLSSPPPCFGPFRSHIIISQKKLPKREGVKNLVSPPLPPSLIEMRVDYMLIFFPSCQTRPSFSHILQKPLVLDWERGQWLLITPRLKKQKQTEVGPFSFSHFYNPNLF